MRYVVSNMYRMLYKTLAGIGIEIFGSHIFKLYSLIDRISFSFRRYLPTIAIKYKIFH